MFEHCRLKQVYIVLHRVLAYVSCAYSLSRLFYVIGITFVAENDLSCRFICFKGASTGFSVFLVIFSTNLQNIRYLSNKLIFFLQ